MTTLLVVIAISISVAALLHRLRNSGSPGNMVAWTATLRSALPLRVVRPALGRQLRDLHWETAATDYVCESFRRGDRNLTRLPGRHDDHWFVLPLILTACFDEANGESVVILRFTSLRWVTFSDADIQFFHELADAECKSITRFLEQFTRRHGDECRGNHAGNGHRRHRWYPKDGDARSGQDAAHPADPIEADLALLGLNPGATMEQVKKAYRVACRKYHPDRLTGQNVEPYLVELAVQRFKEVVAAYQRLCEHFAQPQHA
ncbi:MAG: J domain-containing protein [Phycisphaerales bacterium]|nr:J domain-containing protein [Phycisphaerales bacterium]